MCGKDSAAFANPKSFFVESQFLNRHARAGGFQVEVYPEVAGGRTQVADAVLVAVFAAVALVHLVERLGLVGGEKTAHHIGGFGFGVHLLLVLNRDFHIVGEKPVQCVSVARTQCLIDGLNARGLGVGKGDGRKKEQQEKQSFHCFKFLIMNLFEKVTDF